MHLRATSSPFCPGPSPRRGPHPTQRPEPVPSTGSAQHQNRPREVEQSGKNKPRSSALTRGPSLLQRLRFGLDLSWLLEAGVGGPERMEGWGMFMLIEKACWLCLHEGFPDCFNNEMFYGIKQSSSLAQKGQGTEPSAFPQGYWR